jgi:hypothetical protein
MSAEARPEATASAAAPIAATRCSAARFKNLDFPTVLVRNGQEGVRQPQARCLRDESAEAALDAAPLISERAATKGWPVDALASA